MTRADMQAVKDEFVRAAQMAIECDFDLLELHCAHGYLLSSFITPLTNTRTDGLVGTEIRWEPGQNNTLGRRAARDIVEDWPLIATAATRKQNAVWGWFLGASFLQKHWYASPPSGRVIPRLEVCPPQGAVWAWG